MFMGVHFLKRARHEAEVTDDIKHASLNGIRLECLLLQGIYHFSLPKCGP